MSALTIRREYEDKPKVHAGQVRYCPQLNWTALVVNAPARLRDTDYPEREYSVVILDEDGDGTFDINHGTQAQTAESVIHGFPVVLDAELVVKEAE